MSLYYSLVVLTFGVIVCVASALDYYHHAKNKERNKTSFQSRQRNNSKGCNGAASDNLVTCEFKTEGSVYGTMSDSLTENTKTGDFVYFHLLLKKLLVLFSYLLCWGPFSK